jgi:GNAT superfamily N-acetyltransferase
MNQAYTLIKAESLDHWTQVKFLLAKLFEHENNLRTDRRATPDILEGGFGYIQKNVSEKSGAAYLIYYNDLAIGFGTCWCDLGDGLDSGDNRVGVFSDAYILPEHRGQGLYHQLIEARKNHFRALGVKRISVDTLGTNHEMQKILEKCGFSIHKIIYEMKIEG